ncbi:MAG TPA: hypothetical protein VF234_06570, partial [Limnochordia bacterium]
AVLTLSAPPGRPGSAGAPAAGLAQASHAGPTYVELRLVPNQPGDNRLEVRIDPGPGRAAPADVRLRLLPDGSSVRLRPGGGSADHIFSGSLHLPAPGRYGFEVTYRLGEAVERVLFPDWPLPAPDAAELLKQSEEAMAGLLSVRIHETLSDGIQTGETWYWHVAPDRVKAQVSGGTSELRIIGRDRWVTTDGENWEHDRLAEPVRVPDVSSYTAQATEIHVLGRQRLDGHDHFVVAFRYGDSATRFKVWIDTESYRMRRLEMIYPRHYMVWRFDQFDAPVAVTPPDAD